MHVVDEGIALLLGDHELPVRCPVGVPARYVADTVRREVNLVRHEFLRRNGNVEIGFNLQEGGETRSGEVRK